MSIKEKILFSISGFALGAAGSVAVASPQDEAALVQLAPDAELEQVVFVTTNPDRDHPQGQPAVVIHHRSAPTDEAKSLGVAPQGFRSLAVCTADPEAAVLAAIDAACPTLDEREVPRPYKRRP